MCSLPWFIVLSLVFFGLSSPPQDIYFLNFDCYQTVAVFFEVSGQFWALCFLFFPS